MASAEHTEHDAAALEELAYVGPRTAERLAAAGIEAADVRDKRVSYRNLVDADVNPGVAAKLRREHSLHWTLDEQGADLDRRSELVRGLQDGERAWVASALDEEEASGTASDDGDASDDAGSDDSWSARTLDERDGEDVESADSDADDALAAEAAWRERANGSP